MADISGDIDDAGYHPLADKTGAVANHADRFAIPCHQRVCRLAHVGPGRRIGCQHPPAGVGVTDQHVNADRAGRVQPVHHSHRGDVKAQRCYQRERLAGRRGTAFNRRTQGFQQRQQFGPARRPGRHPDRWQVLDDRCRRFWRDLLGPVDVLVKALADLFAHLTTRQPLGSDHAGSVTRLFKILVVDGFHHRVGDIQRRQVHQFKRPEFEADLVFENAVNRGEIGHAFIDDAKCLRAVATTGVVHDETRRVLCQHGRVAHLTGESAQAFTAQRVGFQSGDHFDHLHQGHWVEKMEPCKTARMRQFCRNRSDRQGRCVACQDRGGANDLLQV